MPTLAMKTAAIPILMVFSVSGCCRERTGDGPASTASAVKPPTPPSPPEAGAPEPGASPTRDIALASCKAVDNSFGAWRPNKRVLLATAGKIPWETCLPQTRIADALAKCADESGVTTVEVSVELPKYSVCQHTVRALTWEGRHWVSINTFVGVGAQFHGQSFIYEITDAGPVAAYQGFLGASSLCGSELTGEHDITSVSLKSIWSQLPKSIQEEFFCGRMPEPEDTGGASAVSFFKEQIAACNAYLVKVGNEDPGSNRFDGSEDDPTRTAKVRKKLSEQRYEIEDAEGTVLVVDLAKRIITAPGGPEAVMPRTYSFCQPTVFVGTTDH